MASPSGNHAALRQLYRHTFVPDSRGLRPFKSYKPLKKVIKTVILNKKKKREILEPLWLRDTTKTTDVRTVCRCIRR